MTEYRQRLQSIKPLDSVNVASFLANIGESENLSKSRALDLLLGEFGKENFFYIAIVESLEWAGYTKPEKVVFQKGVAYLNGDIDALKYLKQEKARLSAERAIDVLIAWRTILSIKDIELHDFDVSLGDFIDARQRLLGRLESYRLGGRKHNVSGLAEWTFNAPFKVAALMKQEWWKREGLDKLPMPQGSQVMKGLKYLIKQGFDEADKGVSDEVEIAHMYQQELAKAADSRALHINTGLHLIGLAR